MVDVPAQIAVMRASLAIYGLSEPGMVQVYACVPKKPRGRHIRKGRTAKKKTGK